MAAFADVHPIAESYLDGLRRAVCARRPGQSLLVLFLGSTIGNFERAAAEDFLREVRACLMPGDALLLGADLIKPLARMLLAYDDPAGVTAAFNRNLLARINRELNADFALRSFAHEARWDAAPPARRDASALAQGAARTRSAPPPSSAICARTKPSGRSPATSSTPTRSARWRPRRASSAARNGSTTPGPSPRACLSRERRRRVSRRVLPHRRARNS